MKTQIENLSAYQPGLNPEELKKSYNIEGPLYKLASNENLYGPSPKAKKAIKDKIDNIQYYPDTTSLNLRKAIGDTLNIDENRILLGAGLDDIITIISRAIIKQGDKLITSNLTFGQYYHNGVIESANIVKSPLKNGKFDLDNILEEVDDETALIWLCNPNNPTGTYFTHNELIEFLNKVPSTIPVALDEAYGEFVTAEDFPNALELQEKYKNLFVLRTFSKAYGLASMRIGYVIGDQKIIEKFNIIKPPFNIGRLSEIAAITAYKDQDYINDIKLKNANERQKFFEIPESKHFYPSETNFIFVNTENVNKLFEELLKVGCITRPFPHGIRITIGFPEQNDAMINVLKNFTY